MTIGPAPMIMTDEMSVRLGMGQMTRRFSFAAAVPRPGVAVTSRAGRRAARWFSARWATRRVVAFLAQGLILLAMSKLLKKAFDLASTLPEKEQDELASVIIGEMESERRLQAAFEASKDTLTKLAEAALAEFRAGRTLPLDLDKME